MSWFVQELDDVDAKFKMVTSGLEKDLEVFEETLTPGTRRPSRTSAYTALRKVCFVSPVYACQSNDSGICPVSSLPCVASAQQVYSV